MVFSFRLWFFSFFHRQISDAARRVFKVRYRMAAMQFVQCNIKPLFAGCHKTDGIAIRIGIRASWKQLRRNRSVRTLARGPICASYSTRRTDVERWVGLWASIDRARRSDPRGCRGERPAVAELRFDPCMMAALLLSAALLIFVASNWEAIPACARRGFSVSFSRATSAARC